MAAASVENEISFSINLSQDLLYIILDSYISKKLKAFQEYYDFIDENNIRTRLINNVPTSVRKRCNKLQKFVYVDRDTLVPFVDRQSVEYTIDVGDANDDDDDDDGGNKPSEMLRRIVRCNVFKSDEFPECEVKVEHVYLNKNLIDKLDSLMASRQIMLYNLLQNKNENLVKESHLGSDEIMVAIRLEYEYDDTIDRRVLGFMAGLVRDVDAIAAYQNINPLLPHTTLQNNIIYRKFEEERLIGEIETARDIYKWAVKLDGVRGKGFCTRSSMLVFMDDMQMFSGKLDRYPFVVNNVVAFQCELVEDKIIYITDLLHVFKYGYNNRTQYEVSLDSYNILPSCAVECIDHLAEKYNRAGGLELIGYDDTRTPVKFQRFNDPPVANGGYATVPTDGFVVLNQSMRYVKYKSVKTVEIEYDADADTFKTLAGPLRNRKVCSRVDSLKHNGIYEAVVDDDSITILKHRPDRMIPN
ncbi:LEF-4 [Alphabaculovirus myunipunctae]|uniref:LEF-4 n=1 Tax=Mythimna unipuncta nucleopolyhedrovirus TaxID=447897 RepID=A0A2K9VSC0_9ABAC|nr:LEF-4 [Mythimna unipuncta nucleopolyhedrovirus]AUV65353.1 LEF-4 [Mythimna unipuncta nucleopolyhedrovirus]